MNRVWIQRWPVVLAMLAALLLSGCGGARASSWTGLTVADETLYVADLQQVRAMNPTNGETLWAFPEDIEDDNRGVFYATPAVSADGRVFVTSETATGGILSQQQNIVWALDAETGEDLWRFDRASGRYVEGGALGGDVFVIGNGDGNVYALDAESGSLRWTFETGHRVWATPLIVEDTVYIGSMDRNLYALSLDDGQMKWRFQRKGAFAAMPALKDGTLYIGAFNDTFYAVDAETGEERWHVEGDDWFWGDPAIQDDLVYTVDVKGTVYALDVENGDEIWRKDLVDAQNQGVPVRAGPTLSDDGSQLFINAENGTLYALKASDGVVDWSEPSEGRGLSRPVTSGSLVYQTLISGTPRVRALQIESGREAWAHPPVQEES